jgi:hypothetical protein
MICTVHVFPCNMYGVYGVYGVYGMHGMYGMYGMVCMVCMVCVVCVVVQRCGMYGMQYWYSACREGLFRSIWDCVLSLGVKGCRSIRHLEEGCAWAVVG